MDKRLTDWFPPNVKPARKGVYLRLFPSQEAYYARWDGKNWKTFWGTPARAAQARRVSGFQELPWRGLAEQPK